MSDNFLDNEESQQFFGLIQMLQRSALVALGQMPDHEGNHSVNTAEAKAAIDIIAVLHKRTNGNLSGAEETVLQGILTELRMIFVQGPSKVAQQQAEQEAAEELKKTFTEPAEAPAEVLTTDSSGEEE
ncbi:MAG TPA: DUF1844 domain-containing protein [Candidatus Thalassarchaeaceae archaeon]|jgi:GrpB-like predicted nucleotidyltransferase (UPF0157 family)|nr:DUF1844 domain-containing protein [Candidatus Poseidoniaceae archaeon]HJM20103.1 DUF1844 domain-containing protein [Candidatus Thalassarchaeaceae archaeon]HJM87242.1 DUF1844 domain-containing protein [Candidatus Thalassarchaeaceae archaeon]